MSDARRIRASDSQTLFWIQQMRNPERCSANVSSLVGFRESFDCDRFRAAVALVMERHEIFRTAFDWGTGELEQVVYERVASPVTMIRIPGESLSDKLLSDLTMHRFAHADAPLFRITIVETPGRNRYVHMVAHHSIYDLHTQELFQSDLERAYRGDTLEPVSAHYADFALAEHLWKESAEASRQREFWKSHTEAFPELHQIPSRSAVAAGSVYVDMGAVLSARVRDFCIANRTAVFLVVGAAYEIALSLWFRTRDFGLGVPFTNRRNPDVGDVAGCCMNILPLRITIAPTDSFTSVLASFRRQMLVGHRNQELSILETLSLAGRPLYRFGFTADAPLHPKLDGCDSEPLDCPRPGALALFYHVEEDSDRGLVRIRADYSGEDLGPDDARRFSDHFLELLTRVLQDPLREIGSPEISPLLAPRLENV